MKQQQIVSGIRVEKLDEKGLKARGVFSWPVWEKNVASFDWTYNSQEECYFLEGKVTIETDAGEVHIGKGDFVIFPKGLSCFWDVKEAVRKHYRFQ